MNYIKNTIKNITLSTTLLFSINTMAADVYNALVNKEHHKFIPSTELPVELEEIGFFTSKGVSLKGKEITTTGVSTFSDSSCWDFNFGQHEWLGDSRGYTPVNPDLAQTRFCSSGEKIQDAQLTLPITDGKYYFEMTLANYTWANYMVIKNGVDGGTALSMGFGSYYGNSQYTNNRIGSRDWNIDGFYSGETYQVYIDTENGNITLVELGLDGEENYNGVLY